MTAARRLAAILFADVVDYSRLMREEKACIVIGLLKAGMPEQ
jgi:class 3 adenylate cyclase